MTDRPRAADGFVLTELLVVMVIGLLLLGGTLLTFTGLVRNEKENDQRQEQIEAARNGLDIQARQLRNLAKRVDTPVIDTVEPYDFIFQTSDPARTWVRYCLDTSGASGSGRLWEQAQAAPATGGVAVTTAMRSGCPAATGWTVNQLVAASVVNRSGGRDRPLFSYRCLDATAACTATAATFDQLTDVSTALFIDTSPVGGPAELDVRTAVHLRNQNQAPTALLTATPVVGSPRTVLLNASGSSDAEGRTLEYFWFLGTMPTTIDCSNQTTGWSGTVKTLWGGALLGQGVTYTYTWPGTSPASGATQNVGLVACDPGSRQGYTGPVPVRIP